MGTHPHVPMGTHAFHALSWGTTCLALPRVQQPQSSPNAVFFRFLWSFIIGMIDHFQVLFPPENGGMGLTASNHGLVFLVTGSPPGVQQESPHQNQGYSCHPGNPKGFRNSMSGSRVKVQTWEEKMLLVLLSLKKLYEFWELCARNWRQRPIYTYPFYRVTGIKSTSAKYEIYSFFSLH